MRQLILLNQLFSHVQLIKVLVMEIRLAKTTNRNLCSLGKQLVISKAKTFLVVSVLFPGCTQVNIQGDRREQAAPSPIKLLHFLFKEAGGSEMSKTCVEISAPGNEGLFVPSRTELRWYFMGCFPPALSRFLHLPLTLLRRGRVSEQLLGILLKMLLRSTIVKKLLITRLSGCIIKASTKLKPASVKNKTV